MACALDLAVHALQIRHLGGAHVEGATTFPDLSSRYASLGTGNVSFSTRSPGTATFHEPYTEVVSGVLPGCTLESFRDVVQLSGFVDTEAERLHAATVAESVAGVARVENSLVVKPAS